jgi:peptide/nickel transport system ATP-binding protein/oligopeptide transport system ATP-binding protein
MDALLEIRDLRVEFPSPRGPVRAVDGLSLELARGETYALVGESGCGKSATALSLLRLVEPGEIRGGSIRFEGTDLLGLTEREMRRFRGARIGMVFQEPAASLNPVMRIGWQVAESPRIHHGLGRRQAWEEAVRLLRTVALPDPERQARAYPHELSGGMQQRVMLAIALSAQPALLVADEPTTALDVTIQAQVLALLRQLKADLSLTLLLISHDLRVVAENADRMGVMYAGRLVEEGPVADVLRDPKHPYTEGLLRSLPGEGGHRAEDGSRRLLRTIPGAVPDPAALPSGCRFHPRCERVFDPCARFEPHGIGVGPGRRAACFLHDPAHARRP